ncbi:MAG: hypothetical protein QM687_14390 [Ferruginibacter sp.]
MNIPELKNNQLAVLMADGATGHVLNLDAQISFNEEENIFLIFESIDEVYSFIRKKSAINDTIEFCIYNSKREMIEYIKATRYNDTSDEKKPL